MRLQQEKKVGSYTMIQNKGKDMIKNYIKQCISPELKKYKFKKKGTCWNRISENNCIQVVDLQISSYGNENEGQFTINLGIFDPVIWKKCWGKEIPNFIKEEDCFLRFRMGELINDFPAESKDIWWQYNDESKIEDLCIEIVEMLENVCIPFFEKVTNYVEIDKLLITSQKKMMPIEKIYWAILKYEIKEFDSAQKLLDEVASISDVWEKRVEFVESQLN